MTSKSGVISLWHDTLSVPADKPADCCAVFDGLLMLLHHAATEALCARMCISVWPHVRACGGTQGSWLALSPGQAKYNSIPISWSSPIPRTLCSPRGEE